MHRSFHTSGRSHLKEEEKGKKLDKGETSDSSAMNDRDKTHLTLGVESFHIDDAPASGGTLHPNTVFLSPPNGVSEYSILWLWVPVGYSQSIHPRLFYVNIWDVHSGYNTFQTAALADLSMTIEMKTILTLNDCISLEIEKLDKTIRDKDFLRDGR